MRSYRSRSHAKRRPPAGGPDHKKTCGSDQQRLDCRKQRAERSLQGLSPIASVAAAATGDSTGIRTTTAPKGSQSAGNPAAVQSRRACSRLHDPNLPCVEGNRCGRPGQTTHWAITGKATCERLGRNLQPGESASRDGLHLATSHRAQGGGLRTRKQLLTATVDLPTGSQVTNSLSWNPTGAKRASPDGPQSQRWKGRRAGHPSPPGERPPAMAVHCRTPSATYPFDRRDAEQVR